MKVSLEKIRSSFLAFEVQHKLFELRVKEKCFWDYIRVTIFEQIVTQNIGYNSESRKRSYWVFASAMFKYMGFRLLSLLKTLPACDVLLVNTAYGKYQDGGKKEIYMHPLADSLGSNYRVMLYEHFQSTIDSSQYNCDVYFARHIFIYHRFKSLFVSFNHEEKKVFKDIKSKIWETFKVDIDVYNIAKNLFAFQITYENFFLELLLKLRPKLLIYCDNGNVKGLISAANQCGVTTIDFQHGVATPFDIAYQYSDQLSTNLIKKTIPKYIYTFGDFWTSEFNIPTKLVPIGFPYFDIMTKQFPLRKNIGNRKNIIIVSVMLSRNELANLAINLAKRLPEYKIYFKLRNIEYNNWQDYYPIEFSQIENLVIIDNDEQSIYHYFSLCNYQVGTNSTALYEGLAFGLKTFILKTGRYEEVKSLFNSGYAELVESADEIHSLILNEKFLSTNFLGDKFFKPNSKRNFNHNITALLEKN